MFLRQFNIACHHQPFSTSCFHQAKVKKKNISQSSRDWLTRHLKDPYVKQGLELNLRARSGFKLQEINEKYKFLVPGKVVLECGAAPGAWTQVTVGCVKPEKNPDGFIVATDLLTFFPVKGATILPLLDFRKESTIEKILQTLDGRKIDVCLSDMSPNLSGQKEMDQENSLKLVRMFYDFAIVHSNPGACLLCKIRSGPQTTNFMKEVSQRYGSATMVKPHSSRSDSSEIYIFASNFKADVLNKQK